VVENLVGEWGLVITTPGKEVPERCSGLRPSDKELLERRPARSVTKIPLRITDRTSLSSGLHCCFVFGRSHVKISARRPPILTEVFRVFPQSLQANAGTVL
jgi:hypothetical protein